MLLQDDEKFMLIAIEEAAKGKALGDLPFGAAVVLNNTIVGRGKAENGTTGDVTDHAEMIALRNACKTIETNDLKDCTIYCTNEPCIMCSAAIFQAGIANVKIALSRDDLPQLLRPRKIRIADLAEDSGYKISITKGILKNKVLALFRNVKK